MKMKNMKRILALVLLMLSVFAVALPAMAVTSGTFSSVPFTQSVTHRPSTVDAMIDVTVNLQMASSTDSSWKIEMYARRKSQSRFELQDTKYVTIKGGELVGRRTLNYNIRGTQYETNKDWIVETYFKIYSNGETYFGGVSGSYRCRP